MSNRGICNEFTGNLRRALEDQTDAIELWEGNASAYANRSFLFVKTGELGHAKKDASRARELDPSCRIPEF
jgi:tetratricopeptide (TPR) repeat protein